MILCALFIILKFDFLISIVLYIKNINRLSI